MHAAHEEQHALGADLDDGEVGGRGRPGDEGGVEGAGGGACRERLGGVGEEGLGILPLPQPHPPNRPFPHPQHLVHAGEVPAGQIPSNVQGLLGGGGVQVCGVGLVVFVSGVGGPQVKKSPLHPILGVGEGRQSMMGLVATISSMSPRCSSTVSQRASPASPRAVPACTATW